jgi:outer membrane lipoprotein carrier protein
MRPEAYNKSGSRPSSPRELNFPPAASWCPLESRDRRTQLVIKKSIALIIAALLLVSAASAAAADLQSVAKAVDEHYNHLRSLQAEFTEIYRGAGMDRTESGTLWLKKPGKMRWEYRSPRDKLFLSDGKDAWFYLPADKQARKTPVRKLEDLRSPLGFLLGKTRLEKELQALGFAPDLTPVTPGNMMLRGVPQRMADRVNQVLLEITPNNRISRILIDEVDGSTTEYRFTEQKENVGIGDERFRFTPPPGVETIDSELGQ